MSLVYTQWENISSNNLSCPHLTGAAGIIGSFCLEWTTEAKHLFIRTRMNWDITRDLAFHNPSPLWKELKSKQCGLMQIMGDHLHIKKISAQTVARN